MPWAAFRFPLGWVFYAGTRGLSRFGRAGVKRDLVQGEGGGVSFVMLDGVCVNIDGLEFVRGIICKD